MLKDLSRGAGFVLRGFELILRPGLRRYVAIPAALNVLLFLGLTALTAVYFDGLMARLIPDWAGWLEYVLWPLFALAALLIGFYSFTLVANLIGAPFNERLAIAVAERLGWTGHGIAPPFLAGVGRTMLGELRKWLYFAGLIALLALLWLIPVTTLLTPFLWLVLSAWMLALEYLDHPLELDALPFRAKRAWMRERRCLCLGFGFATLGATLVPVVNFLVMPAAVAGSTALWSGQSGHNG